ncbi:hypothetical protein C6A88_00310, partial [Mycolicibacterium austroafricanum]
AAHDPARQPYRVVTVVRDAQRGKDFGQSHHAETDLAGRAAGRATRKVGLGVMGLAEVLASLGIPYDSDDAVRLAGRIMGR